MYNEDNNTKRTIFTVEMQRNRIIYFNSGASKPLRISSNSLLQAAGDGAVSAAPLADSPSKASKTSGEAAGVLVAGVTMAAIRKTQAVNGRR